MRGDVYRLENRKTKGAIQSGKRYCIDIGNNQLFRGDRMLVAPTTTSRPNLGNEHLHVRIEVEGQTCYVMCEQASVVVPEYIGRIVADVEIDMEQVDNALRYVFDLPKSIASDEEGGTPLSW